MSLTVTNSISETSSFVDAPLNYLIPMVEKPFHYIDEPPSGVPRQNGAYETRQLPIRNARLLEEDTSLDREGFVLIESKSPSLNFYDVDEIRSLYYAQAEQLVKEVTGATQVIVFDHNLRNARKAKQKAYGVKEPVKRVHNDFTATSGYRRAKDELIARGVDNPDLLLQHRFSIVNVWRSIAEPVQESPIAVCDARSIASTDLVASDLIYRDRVGETYVVTYNPSHQWFYFPQMRPDEALLIKCFDLAQDGRARFTAHGAFDDPTSLPNAPTRESIELRTLVFYPV